MWSKVFLLVCAVSCAYSQPEQAIFAQLYYPPLQHVKPTTTPVPPVPSPTAPSPSPSPRARTLQQLRESVLERMRRSAFDEDLESNDAMFKRLRALMQDPNWVPEIRPRNNYID